MLVVISPAKKLDMSPTDTAATVPGFAKDANALAAVARDLSRAELQELMDIIRYCNEAARKQCCD